ncbi:hypothetical protein [Candidatus Nitrosocosmicus franklandus]|uniref:Uncharacterized protein n=1 Tax=Candidatus Nitrosocosmicus franklandianus TaxID=1798806 RepID=A0A484I4M3_9ARCH|nr:hypothetical protein [Candidatus Nitrosocosmicus franklandus]VFJ12615.1 conserved protein of unknown function [Candidatus Nitrosocosmicus franklandus]
MKRSFYLNSNKKITSKGIMMLMLLPLFFISTSEGIKSINASSDGDVSCYDKGIIDGEDHPFNQGMYNRCGEDYYHGFLQGCMSVEGNDRDICESATDA